MTGYIIALLTSVIGGLIGTYCGSRFLHIHEENKMKNVRNIAIEALNIINKYSKQSYGNAVNEFNTSLSITKKRIIIVALHKLGIPISIPTNEVFNIKRVHFADKIVDKDEIDGIILQIDNGYCDNLFYIDPDTYFAANFTLFAMRNVAKRYVKEVLAKSECNKEKRVWYPENWVQNFGVGEYLILRILHEQLCVDYIYDNKGKAIPEKMEQIVHEIDMGIWDNSLQINYEIYKNAKTQTEMNNVFQSLVSQQRSDVENKNL